LRLLLVRHGESICGSTGVIGGVRGCTGLTERGFAQARALRDRFATEGFTADRLYASTLPRAIQTAETVGEALGGLPVKTDEELCELLMGDADGLTWDEWRERWGFDVSSDFDRPLSPNAESLNTFGERVRRVIDRLADTHDGETVVACCHGGVIAGSLFVLTGADRTAAILETDHTSITEWVRNNGRWTLVRFNDVGHLANTGLLVRT
jgi:broad specificity phosphatase PhoE